MSIVPNNMSIHILATYCLHVFADGVLEHSAFPGGYFDSDGNVRYYISDWQGLNVYDSSSAPTLSIY